MIKQPAMSPQEVAVAKLSPLNGSQMPHWKRFRARLPIVVTPTLSRPLSSSLARASARAAVPSRKDAGTAGPIGVVKACSYDVAHDG